MTISEFQKEVNDWISNHGVRYFDPMTNMVLLMEETGELSRLMARMYGEQSFKEEPLPSDVMIMISDEMADIIFVLTCLANQTNIDLTSALESNLRKKTMRDSQRHHDNRKLSNSDYGLSEE